MVQHPVYLKNDSEIVSDVDDDLFLQQVRQGSDTHTLTFASMSLPACLSGFSSNIRLYGYKEQSATPHRPEAL